MGASLKFKHMNENGSKIAEKLITNEKFVRYIKCLSDDPLNQVISEENLYSDLIQKRDKPGHIILKKFNEKILTDSKVLIFLSPSRPDNFNSAMYSDIYILDIIVPDDYVVLEGQGSWRYASIAEEIAKEIDEEQVAGLGKCYITGYSCDPIKEYGEGMRLQIRVDNASMCGE